MFCFLSEYFWVPRDAPQTVQNNAARHDHIIHGCSVILHDSIFHMWYNGHSGQDIEKNWGIGHATSPDGINWTPDQSNPVHQEDAEAVVQYD